MHTKTHSVVALFSALMLVLSLASGALLPMHTYAAEEVEELGTEDTEELCSDEQDNDGDELVDLDDPDCAAFVPEEEPTGSFRVCKIVADQFGNILNDNMVCEQWADHALSFAQGLRKDGSAVLTEHSDPIKALGPAENNDTPNFVSLGYGGSLVLAFDNFIINGPGNDIEVMETTYDNQTCGDYPERVRVYASQDGVSWTDLGEGCLDSQFDLGPLSWARYLKLVDVTDPDSELLDDETDGFDVDGVRVFHCGSAPTGVAFTIPGVDPAVTSEIPATAVWGTAIFDLPLTYTHDLLESAQTLDAECRVYDELVLGSYYYGEEIIEPPFGWLPPRYNDQFTALISSLNDFFVWSDELYDGNPGNDNGRDKNSDGHIILTTERPDRTLVVLNQLEVPEIPAFENTEPLCTDEQDNDGDELVDVADPDCAPFQDNGGGGEEEQTEDTEELCTDEEDNDGDELVDADDPDCEPFQGGGGEEEGLENTESLCTDEQDNDGDELIDADDPDCAPFYEDEGEDGGGPVQGGGGGPGGVYLSDIEQEPAQEGGGTTNGTSTESTGGGEVAEGEVLGVATCGVYLNEYIKLGADNNTDEVVKLQEFLNRNMGSTLPATGFYGPLTFQVVKDFQLKYKDEVLTPWASFGFDPDVPSGWVYKTTKRWVNMLECPELDLPMPELP